MLVPIQTSCAITNRLGHRDALYKPKQVALLQIAWAVAVLVSNKAICIITNDWRLAIYKLQTFGFLKKTKRLVFK